MSVSREQVSEIAALARLRLTSAEAAKFATQLSEILDHVAELAAADTEAIVDQPPDTVAPLREDRAGADPIALPPSEMAPDWRSGFFAVPRLAAMDGDVGDPGTE